MKIKQDYRDSDDTRMNEVASFVIGTCFGIILMAVLGAEWWAL